ncbi:MAG: RNA polymerase sigma-70 factor (ECF subfamily), partial [Verrucomicrobiales bacterium]
MESLEQQIQACLNGDVDAFAAVVDAHESDVRAVIASMCPDAGLVQDLVQEVFLIVYRKLDTYQSGTNLRAWIKTIARNVAQNER